MDLSIKWNKENYQEFLKYLKANSDSKYKEFHQKLLKNDKIKVIGIRMPILKKMVKDIIDPIGFIKYNTHTYYEENMLHGLVLNKIKDNFIYYVHDFVNYIDNWAVNDSVASSLKQFKNMDIKEVEYFITSKNPWSVRFGLTLLLNHYVTDKYIDKVLKISDNIDINDYYVQMANSWLISVCYIKYQNKTEEFLKQTKIDDFTYNKAISKICDSYRVSNTDKNKLKKTRRNL